MSGTAVAGMDLTGTVLCWRRCGRLADALFQDEPVCFECFDCYAEDGRWLFRGEDVGRPAPLMIEFKRGFRERTSDT